MISGSLLFVCAPCACVIPLAVTGCVSALPCASTRALLCALFNGNSEDKQSRMYLSSISHLLSCLVGFTITVKLTK